MGRSAHHPPRFSKPYHRVVSSARTESTASDKTLVSSVTPVFSIQPHLNKEQGRSSQGPLRIGFPSSGPLKRNTLSASDTPVHELLGPCFTRQTDTTTTRAQPTDTGVIKLPSIDTAFPWTTWDAPKSNDYERDSDSDSESDRELDEGDNYDSDISRLTGHRQSPTSSDSYSDKHVSHNDDDDHYPGREITTTVIDADDFAVPLYHPKPQYPSHDITGQNPRWTTPHLTPSPMFPRPVQDVSRYVVVVPVGDGAVRKFGEARYKRRLDVRSRVLPWPEPALGSVWREHLERRKRYDELMHTKGFRSLVHETYRPASPPSSLPVRFK